ncbi:uncharacterized protein LOC143902674 isoform X2 [Temnothorax americanus]|uniref:uncharacterized protein LOC143902674 isoform X2 n=1 Tax=Temnothorax americanus TaxID=1964332 RepID=UPI004068BB67
MGHGGHAKFLLPLFMATAMSLPIRNSYDRRVYKYDHFPSARYVHQIMPFHVRQSRANYIPEENIYNTNVFRPEQEEPKDNQLSGSHVSAQHFKRDFVGGYENPFGVELNSGGESGQSVHNYQVLNNDDKTVTIIKKVAVPFPVEKTIRYPVIKRILYPVKVPVPQPYAIEKKIPYPVKVFVKVPIKIPRPVPVVKEVPYPVTIPVDRPVPVKVYVPKPYPIERKIHYEVKIPVAQPYPIERRIPIPVKIPIHVPQPYPVEKIVHHPLKINVEKPVSYPVKIPSAVPIDGGVKYR